MLRRLDIVSIRVRDWGAAVEWYKEKLGLVPRGLHDDPWCLMTFPESGTSIALDGTNPAVPGKSNIIPTILAQDLRNTVATLRSRGVEFSREIEESDEGYRMASFRDLEGNLINLYENIK